MKSCNGLYYSFFKNVLKTIIERSDLMRIPALNGISFIKTIYHVVRTPGHLQRHKIIIVFGKLQE